MKTCVNCGKPATIYQQTSHGEVLTCDRCRPGDATGEIRPLVVTLPDLSGRVTLSRQEAADTLGVSLDYFDKHVKSQIRIIMRGRRVMVSVRELEAWVETHNARALKD